MNVVKLHLIFLKGAFGFFGMFYILYALYEIYQYNYERCSITAVLRLIKYSTNFCKIRKFKSSYICPSRKKDHHREASKATRTVLYTKFAIKKPLCCTDITVCNWAETCKEKKNLFSIVYKNSTRQR